MDDAMGITYNEGIDASPHNRQDYLAQLSAAILALSPSQYHPTITLKLRK